MITSQDIPVYPYAVHVDLRPMGPHQCLLTSPNGQRFELEADAETAAEWLTRCDGSRTLTDLAGAHARPEDFREVLETLLEAGCLIHGEPHADPRAQMDLYLMGDPQWCLEAETLAGPWRAIIRVPAENLPQPRDPSQALLVALSPFIDGDWLTSLDQHAARLGCAWTQLHGEAGAGFLGPYVIPGRTSDYRDLIGRRRCSGDDVEGAQMRRPLLPDEGAPTSPMQPTAEIRRLWLNTLFAEIENALTHGPCRLFSTELELDPRGWTVHSHPILPLPTRVPPHWLASPASDVERLVDRRTGIILDQHLMDHHESLPNSLLTVRSHCTDLARIYPWGNDLFVGGSTFGDESGARGASLGEALERYCGNCLPGVATVNASYNQLMQQGRRALDPQSLILHSQKMLDQPGCPFVPFTRDLQVHWVEGRSITRDEPCLLPLSLVYANWMGGDLEQPLTNYLYTPGMAAGQNLERALVGACRELVERDSTMVWWLNADVIPAVKSTPALDALWESVPDRDVQRVRYIHLDNPFGIPVFAASVFNTRDHFLNIGFGCRPNPEDAARKALTEALTLQEGSRDLVRPDSVLRSSSEDWNLLSVKYKPWREDRSYMDAFRKDFRDINDLMLQQQFFLDPRAVDQVLPLCLPNATRTFDSLPQLADDSFDSYRKPLEDKGFEILYADITSPDAALTAYRVVRVIIPGLVPNMPAAFPAVGGDRVFQLPVTLGRRTTPLTEDQLNSFPMPHA